jgi:hypothetical protein
MSGEFNGNELSTIQVSAKVNPEHALNFLMQIPQTTVISTLYAVHHRGNGPGDSLVRLMEDLRYEDGKWDDGTVERIAVQQKPENLVEEEFMHLSNLKGSLIWLSWVAVGGSSIPDDLKASFAPPDGEELSDNTYDSEIGQLSVWERENPNEAGKLYNEPDVFEKPVTRVCERLQELAEFYNIKQPIVAVYKVVFPEGYTPGKLGYIDELMRLTEYERDMRRYSIIASLMELFDADDQLSRLMVDMGAKET